MSTTIEQTWTEKYRPLYRDGIVGQPDIHNIKVREGIPPDHMLFIGPPGVGKTTAGRAIARETFGKMDGGYKTHYHEFNASDVSGIDFVRTTLTRLFSYSYPKIIMLDEADRISPDAQQAMRHLMEQTNGNTCLILTANNPMGIHEAVVSRCKVIVFSRLSDELILRQIIKILDGENIRYDFGSGLNLGATPDALAIKFIIDNSGGDMRRVIKDLDTIVENGQLVPSYLEGKQTVDFLVDALDLALQCNYDDAATKVEDALLISALNTDAVMNKMTQYIKNIKDDYIRWNLTVKLSEVSHRLKFGGHLEHYLNFLSFAAMLSATREKSAIRK